MAASSNKQVLLLMMAAVAAVECLASPASATQWTVGDDRGWTEGFNQTSWADGKTFLVGDTLQFVYPKGEHTVVQVGQDDFAACNVNGSNQLGSWCSGNDVVKLDKPSKAWFICTVSDHCADGMKLAVDVVAGPAVPTPSPLPSAPSPLPSSPTPSPLPSPPSPLPSPPVPFPFPGTPPAPSPSIPWPLPRRSPTPAPATAPAPAPSPLIPWPLPWGSPGPAPGSSASSAAVRISVGGVVAAAAAAVVVAAALAF